MDYMSPIVSTSHEWWKDKPDAAARTALLNSYRARLRQQYAAGWRRNGMLCILAIAVPVLLHLLLAT